MNQQNQRLTSYKDINELHETNYSDRQFTEFESSIFNLDINPDTLTIETTDCDKLYSLCAFYEVYKDYKKVITIVHKLLSLGDTRGYLKLGVYLLDCKKDENKAFEIFKIGASKGDIICICNVGVQHIQNKNYEEAIKYFLDAIKQNKFDVCVNIFYCYAMLDDLSTGYKFLKLGIKNNDERSMDTFCRGFSENDLYYVLLKFEFTNELIQTKLNELRPRIINEKYCENIFIHSDTGELFNTNFDVLLLRQDNKIICEELKIDEYSDIFEFLEDLLKKEKK